MPALLLLGLLAADPYYVRTDGVDSPDRDGRSDQTAFLTLAYACERAPENATIVLRGGQHRCTRPAKPKSGQNILGRGFHGASEGWSRLVADRPNWERPTEDEAGQRLAKIGDVRTGEASIVFARKVADVRFAGVKFESPVDASDSARLLAGGVYLDDCSRTTFDTCRFENFAFFGIGTFVCDNTTIDRCGFAGCSQEKVRHRGGQVYTRWTEALTLRHCRLAPAENGGYGYKGGGHTGAQIHDNTFETAYFAFESPHENEAGVEIHHNVMRGAISIPKGGDAAPPQKRGFDYSFDIHHNILTDSYVIEGPRNYLNVHHNLIRIEKPGGRVYTQFGGDTDGPIWIHHNIMENVDRSIVWQREGRTANLFVTHNTIVAADAGRRNGLLFSAWAGDRIDNWVVRDNVIVHPYSHPRRLLRAERGVAEKIDIAGNVMFLAADVPEGNLAADPDLRRGDPDDPVAFYSPSRGDGPTVGTATGINWSGDTPQDVGAVQSGQDFGTLGPRR